MGVIIFLIIFVCLVIVLPLVICYKQTEHSPITEGALVELKSNLFDKHTYCVEHISTFGTCTIRRVDGKREKQIYIMQLSLVKKPFVFFTPKTEEKKELTHYVLPYANCPNCGGKFEESMVEDSTRKTCKCAYCDSVFPMEKY